MSIKNEIARIQANIAAAFAKIAEKGGFPPSSAVSANLASAIDSIPTGTDTSDATAAAGDILSGKTAYVKGVKVTGSIASKGAGDLTASGAEVSVPAGYYPGNVSKSVAAADQATPSITVDSAGKITASAAQSAGYVSAGTKSAAKQLATQAAATITPGVSAKTAVAAGRYTTGDVTVAGDANLKAENIKSGVSVFGVAGSYTGGSSGGVSLTAVTATFMNVVPGKAFFTSDNKSIMNTLTINAKGQAAFSAYGPFVLSASPKDVSKTVFCSGTNVVVIEISKGYFFVLPTAATAIVGLIQN